MQFTDQQKEKFYELKNKLLNESGPKRLALSQQKRQLKDLLTKENLDKKAIQETQDKINSLRTELANVQIAFRLEMQEQLTPDQRKTMRYRSMRAGGKHKMKHHKGGHKRFRANEESENTIGSDSMFSPEGITAANI